MSISESQYYEAKVFLKALSGAYQALEETAKQQAEIDRIKSYESNLVTGVKTGEIRINGEHIQKTNSFNNSRLANISQYTKNFFTNRLQGFEGAQSAGDLQTILEKALK